MNYTELLTKVPPLAKYTQDQLAEILKTSTFMVQISTECYIDGNEVIQESNAHELKYDGNSRYQVKYFKESDIVEEVMSEKDLLALVKNINLARITNEYQGFVQYATSDGFEEYGHLTMRELENDPGYRAMIKKISVHMFLLVPV